MTNPDSSIKPFVILTSNDFTETHLLAYGLEDYIQINRAEKDSFQQLREFLNREKSWVFGYLSYDMKNATEDLESNNLDRLGFPDLFFFRPKKIKSFKTHQALEDFVLKEFGPKPDKNSIVLSPNTSKQEYIQAIERTLDHIQQGDIYEMNYCMEFKNENCVIDPLTRFFKINAANKAPFSTYFSFSKLHLLCGSPERYVQRIGDRIISQPIKGTIKRGKTAEEDKELIAQLKSDPKERSENIMITDLVRNDLSRTAKRGSVQVPELCEVYTFETVHQLISTVESKVAASYDSIDVLEGSYPMGSMTGAPKISAMKIIEELEDFKRGIYSGAVGYFDPEGNFDFNVVIRSVMYNEDKKYLSVRVGGAITALSDPEREYEECLLKMESLKNALI